jgi:hypothetical protein
MSADKWTILDRIVLAASDLSGSGGAFTAEDLIVRAWQRWPDYFGLQGYAKQYPDSNRVLTKIMGGQSSLRQRGLLRKVGTKRYELTDLGLQAARDLNRNDVPLESRSAELSRELVAALVRMLRSTALAKFTRRETITFSDVSAYWNISPRSSAHQFADRTKAADAAIDLAFRDAEAGGGRTILPGDIPADIGQLRLIRELSAHIRQTFSAEIDVIMSRQHERRL